MGECHNKMQNALQACVNQIEQMKGAFDDHDGAIQSALDNAYESLISKITINQPAALKVKVEVSGGVAEVTECHAGVEVELIDHDNLKDGSANE